MPSKIFELAQQYDTRLSNLKVDEKNTLHNLLIKSSISDNDLIQVFITMKTNVAKRKISDGISSKSVDEKIFINSCEQFLKKAIGDAVEKYNKLKESLRETIPISSVALDPNVLLNILEYLSLYRPVDIRKLLDYFVPDKDKEFTTIINTIRNEKKFTTNYEQLLEPENLQKKRGGEKSPAKDATENKNPTINKDSLFYRIPSDILPNILNYLSYPDITNIARASKYFSFFVKKNQKLLENYPYRDFEQKALTHRWDLSKSQNANDINTLSSRGQLFIASKNRVDILGFVKKDIFKSFKVDGTIKCLVFLSDTLLAIGCINRRRLWIDQNLLFISGISKLGIA